MSDLQTNEYDTVAKEILEKMELKQTGNKTTLIERIIENLNK